MKQQERLDLKRLMNASSDYEDNTEGIRRLKHSDLIIVDIKKIEMYKDTMKHVRRRSQDEFYKYCQSKCTFLYNQYTDIFNRLVKDELDIPLMYQMLETLKKIEDGKIDQQEGSVVIGKILHKIFVESALKHRNNVELSLADKGNDEVEVEKNEGKNIDWTTFKKQKLAQSSK